MQRVSYSCLRCTVFLLCPLVSWPAVSDVLTTTAPFTYAINYESNQAADAEFRERFERAVPDLFHPGPDLRFLGRHGFGAGLHANRTFDYDAYLEEARAYTDFLHAKGVRWVTPYLCNQTITGNDVQRTGAWAVYDRWEDFARLGLGERPPDLLEWMQRQPSGNLHYNYKRMCFLERGQSAELIRYAPCPNNPQWRRFCDNEARLAAVAGCDGLFVDNCILHCYCEHCEARFQQYLRRRYTPEKLREAFGTERYADVTLFAEGDLVEWARTLPGFISWLEAKYPPAERRIPFDTTGPLDQAHVDNAGGGMLPGEAAAFVAETVLRPGTRPSFEAVRLANPAIETPEGRLRWAETKMFWADSIGDMLEEMRDTARAVDPDFFLIPNWGTMHRVAGAAGRAEDAKDMQRWTRGASFQMYEEDHTTGLIAPGVVLDYAMELRFAFANGVRAALLPYNLVGEAIEEVALAETAASGGSVFVSMRRYPELQNRYQRFFRENALLYNGYESAAEVGLANLFDQVHYLNIEHLRHVHALDRYLADQQIPFDHVIERDLALEGLRRYRVVILPQVSFLEDEAVAALEGYVREGGTLVIIGDVATHDGYCRPRAPAPAFCGHAGAKGRVVRFDSLAAVLPQDGIYLEPALQAARNEDQLTELTIGMPGRYSFLAKLDQDFWFKRYQEPGPLTEAIAAALGCSPHLMEPHQANGMRSTVYRKRDAGTVRLVVHLVNENIPLTAPGKERRLRPVEKVWVCLPVPAGATLAGPVRVLVPGKGPQEKAATASPCRLTLENLGAYTVIAADYRG